jgi:hypothetical protein
MRIIRTRQGFNAIYHEEYLEPHDKKRIAQESLAIGDYEDSWNDQGSAYLWIGENHHLNREQVAELVAHLQRWLDTGSLAEND